MGIVLARRGKDGHSLTVILWEEREDKVINLSTKRGRFSLCDLAMELRKFSRDLGGEEGLAQSYSK